MASNQGSQVITVKFFDPVDSAVANRIAIDLRKVGIYSGGYLTRVNDTTVTVSTFRCEIGDGTYQINAETGAAVSLTVGSATPYVVLRWAYTGSASVDYVDFVAVALGGILANDVVVGKCVFVGSTLTGFDYTTRTNPNIMDVFLKVEPTDPASMYVRVRSGRVSYGAQNYDVVDQLSPLLVAPGSNTWIAAIQVDTSGVVSVAYGSSGSSPTPPNYSGKITLAEVTIASGQTTIAQTNIKDVRSFIGTTAAAAKNSLAIDTDGKLMLSGDTASPGNFKFYGTNAAGVRGWYDVTYYA